MTRLFASLLIQLAYLDHHGQTIHLMMQYVCDTTNITLDDCIYMEAYELLSEIVHAQTVGGMSAVVEVIDSNRICLEVYHDVLAYSVMSHQTHCCFLVSTG